MGVRRAVLLAAAMSQRRFAGGHVAALLQFVHGFRRLGFDVVFLDVLAEDANVDEDLAWLQGVFRDDDGVYAYVLRGHDVSGVGDVTRDAAATEVALNVMGVAPIHERFDYAGRVVFVDIDPGFGQMWKALGLADVFAGHDTFVTIGERIGAPDCTIPTLGFEWITIRPPVVLDDWPVVEGGDAFTSVASWRGPFGPIEYQGKTYGLRVHEFRKLFELPHRTGQRFELALDIDDAEAPDVNALSVHGWERVDPSVVAGDVDSYRRYVQESRAEFMVAKNLYVETKGGWFSDRSVCYLASGKPVLAQDTGIGELYATSNGLLTFATFDEAVAGVHEINGNYGRHARAARSLAEEMFDSDKVLGGLLKKLGVS